MRGDCPNVTYTYPQKCSGCGSGCGASTSVFTVYRNFREIPSTFESELSKDLPISMTQDGERYYYLYNGIGSVTEVISSNESVVNRYRYTPFGQSMVKNESVYNPYQYTGRRYDEERGNYYYRARIYDQQQSRFLSSDPAGQGANLYAYVGGNPVNRRDPSGEMIPMGGLGIGMRFVDGSAGSRSPWNPETCEGGYDSVSDCMQYFVPRGLTYNAYPYCRSLCGGGVGVEIPEPTRPPGVDPWEDVGPGVNLPPKVKCILGNLGLSIFTNPISYGVCAGALTACIGGGMATGGSALFICLGGKGALMHCTIAGMETAAAIAPCL